MGPEMEDFQGTEDSSAIKPWIDLAKERGMTEHRVFKNVLKAFERKKAGTITEQQYQDAMQAFIDGCSAKETCEKPHL